jgi:hypothetical protein
MPDTDADAHAYIKKHGMEKLKKIHSQEHFKKIHSMAKNHEATEAGYAIKAIKDQSQHDEEVEEVTDDWHKDFHISEDQAKEIIAEKYGDSDYEVQFAESTENPDHIVKYYASDRHSDFHNLIVKHGGRSSKSAKNTWYLPKGSHQSFTNDATNNKFTRGKHYTHGKTYHGIGD